MAETATAETKTTDDQVKFDATQYKERLSHRFRTSLGWAKTPADTASEIALDVLMSISGGRQQYIPKRTIDKQAIIRDRQAGKPVEEISRKYGVSTRTVLNYTNT